MSLTDQLRRRLNGAARVVLLGVGSDLRGDDAAGLLVAEQLKNNLGLTVLLGGTAPENLTGEIKKLKPSHLLIVDAAEMKATPGTVRLVELGEIGGFSFSTHALPLKVMIDFILHDHQCEVVVLAIQPQSTVFGAPISEKVAQAVSGLAGQIAAAL